MWKENAISLNKLVRLHFLMTDCLHIQCNQYYQRTIIDAKVFILEFGRKTRMSRVACLSCNA